MDLTAGTFIVNRELGRCTMVSQVRVTSVGACQTTYRSTKLESLADETRPAGLFLDCSCTVYEIVRQGFWCHRKTCDVVDNDDTHAPRYEQLDDRVLFLQMVVTSMRGCVRLKSKTQKTGNLIATKYLVPCTVRD